MLNKGGHTKYRLSSLLESYKLCFCLIDCSYMYVFTSHCTYFEFPSKIFKKRNEGQLKTFAQYCMQFSNLVVWGRKSYWLQIVMQSGCKVDSVAVFKQSLNVFFNPQLHAAFSCTSEIMHSKHLQFPTHLCAL